MWAPGIKFYPERKKKGRTVIRSGSAAMPLPTRLPAEIRMGRIFQKPGHCPQSEY